YINEHFSDDLSLESLSARFAMSPSHFSKKFKAITGFGLSKYITQVRILNAEKLLLHTKLSVTEISLRCGFPDSNYFASVFKARKGIPPYRYAKMHRSLKD
ncbi:MAG: helix-turn-helix transcriptional regulator, partial [Clostridia bacterium]|nr:helix-turn-helix transcriptional regulator [Clostridia bacterium]